MINARLGLVDQGLRVVLALLMMLASPLQAEGQVAAQEKDPKAFLEERGVPAALVGGLLQSKVAIREAVFIEESEILLGTAKETFRSPRMRGSAMKAAPLRAKSALLYLAWQRAFPQYGRQDLLMAAVSGSKSGLSVRGLLSKPVTASLRMDSAVYSVVVVELEGVELLEMFPLPDKVEEVYLAKLVSIARSLELGDHAKPALSVIDEHLRFSALPDGFLSIHALCLLAGGKKAGAQAIADSIWAAGKLTRSDDWFDLAELEYRLGREPQTDRALERAYEAWNEEN